jgi:hypothetical protein
MRKLLIWGYIGLLAVGCADDDPGVESETVVYRTGNVACVSSLGDGDGDGDGDRSFEVRFVFDDCISQCADVLESRCSIEVDGETIRVTGIARTRQSMSSGGTCPAACKSLETTCEGEPVPLGEYRIVVGDAPMTVELPVDIPADESCCFDHPCGEGEEE